jgi:hypothetical protein
VDSFQTGFEPSLDYFSLPRSGVRVFSITNLRENGGEKRVRSVRRLAALFHPVSDAVSPRIMMNITDNLIWGDMEESICEDSEVQIHLSG